MLFYYLAAGDRYPHLPVEKKRVIPSEEKIIPARVIHVHRLIASREDRGDHLAGAMVVEGLRSIRHEKHGVNFLLLLG